MLSNYLKSAFRNLLRNRGYALINILGLAMGIASALIIFAILQFESNFDNYHPEADRLYRLTQSEIEFGELKKTPGLQYPAIPALRNDFPEIEVSSIVDRNFASPVFTAKLPNGDIRRFLEEGKTALAEPAFFQLFHYDWISGDPQTALSKPWAMVISESIAQKYFGTLDVLNEILTVNAEEEWHITGVVKDVAPNSDLPFNIIMRIPVEKTENDHWGSVSSSVQFYLRLAEGVAPATLDERFAAFFAKHRGEELGKDKTLHLQPISQLHHNEELDSFGYTISSGVIMGLGWIGFALLLLACINFVNLSTALAINRSREVGVRKVLGGSRTSLILQFLGETAFVTGLSCLLAIALVELVSPGLQNFMDYPETLDLFRPFDLALPMLGLFLIVTLFAGLYPAIYLSRYQPVEAMRNRAMATYGSGLNLRRGLVILQFAICQVLILGTLLMGSQLNFMINADLGIEKEAVVEFYLPTNEDAEISTLKSQLENNSLIRSVSMSNTGSASSNTWGGNFVLNLDSEKVENYAQIKFVDNDFVKTYRIEVLVGRDFLDSDSTSDVLVNETFARKVGMGDNYAAVLGKSLKMWGRDGTIAGVVRDFHTNSFHRPKEPVIIYRESRFALAAVKIASASYGEALKVIESTWTQVYPEHVFDYQFLDDTIEEFYAEEKDIGQIVNIFTIIAIIIGTMGLFGLASYMAAQRTKEIGIRKVLGAATINILALLSKEYIALILLAFIVAVPVSYYVMQAWLNDFVYRVSISPMLFIGGLFLSILIAFLTVGYKSLRIALTNPVESLRSE